MICVSKPALRGDAGKCVFSAKVALSEHEHELWFSVPLHWAEYINSDSMDAFLLALLPVAMSQERALHLHGRVSEKLLYHVNTYLIPLLTLISPRLKSVVVSADEVSTVSVKQGMAGAATGFSGGVDSFSVLADHFLNQPAVSYRINTLLFNNVGAVPTQRFYEKWEQLSKVTSLTGLELIPIDSNLADLVDLPFQLTHSLRNVACSLLLHGLYDKYYYASTYGYSSTQIASTYDIAYSDPLSLPLMSTESVTVIPTGGQYSRVEKTRTISTFAPAFEMLNVCVAANRIDNCSACWKCGRTLLTLELLGQLDAFASVFDLEHWHRIRSTYIAEYVTNPKKSHDPLTKEIHALAQTAGLPFRGRERAMGGLAACLPEKIFRPFAKWALA